MRVVPNPRDDISKGALDLYIELSSPLSERMIMRRIFAALSHCDVDKFSNCDVSSCNC